MAASWKIRSVVLGGACVALAALPASTGADADPASDTLVAQNVFTPYSPPVSQAMSKALTALTMQAQGAGFPIKVAIIASPTDLGGVPDMFGKPQPYAKFLATEISFNRKQPVLVVMPAGLGTANVAQASALSGLSVSTGGSGSDGLGQTALKAIERLATANGHPVKAPRVSGAGHSSGVSPVLAFGAPAALIVIAALLIGLGRRRLPEEPENVDPPSTGSSK